MHDVRDSSQEQIVLQYLLYFEKIDWFLLDFITFCTMLGHYESDSPNSSTSSTSGMSSDISEDEFVLGSEDIDVREDAEVSDHVLDYGEFVEILEPIATQEESELYAENVARQEEEEEILLSRVSGEENGDNW